jgi:hypothetical protein
MPFNAGPVMVFCWEEGMPGKLLPLTLGSFLLAGCTPTTQYRNTGLIPAAHALPWDGRTVAPGSLRIEGTAVLAGVHENLAPQIGDTALYVPNLGVEGAATIGVARGLELGVRAAYARYSWSSPSAVGAPPLVGNPEVAGAGPEVRFTIPLDEAGRWTIGVAGNMMNYEVPYAEWKLTGSGACAAGTTCSGGYTLVEQSADGHVTMNFAAYPSYSFGPDLGHVFTGFSVHSGFKNEGFTNTPSNDSVQDAGLIFVWAAGYGLNYRGLVMSMIAELPITPGGSPISYTPGGSFSFGAAFDLGGHSPPPAP